MLHAVNGTTKNNMFLKTIVSLESQQKHCHGRHVYVVQEGIFRKLELQ